MEYKKLQNIIRIITSNAHLLKVIQNYKNLQQKIMTPGNIGSAMWSIICTKRQGAWTMISANSILSPVNTLKW